MTRQQAEALMAYMEALVEVVEARVLSAKVKGPRDRAHMARAAVLAEVDKG